MYFGKLKAAVSLAILPSKESLKTVIIALIVSGSSLSITIYGQEKNYVIKMGLKLEA